MLLWIWLEPLVQRTDETTTDHIDDVTTRKTYVKRYNEDGPLTRIEKEQSSNSKIKKIQATLSNE